MVLDNLKAAIVRAVLNDAFEAEIDPATMLLTFSMGARAPQGAAAQKNLSRTAAKSVKQAGASKKISPAASKSVGTQKKGGAAASR